MILACLCAAGSLASGYWATAAWDRWKDEFTEKTGKISGRILEPGQPFTIVYGSVARQMPLSAIENGVDLMQLSPVSYNHRVSLPIRIHPENNTLVVDAEFSRDGKTVFTIVGNEFTFNPDGQFDRNLSLYAFEVIDKSGMPIFQLVLKRPNRIYFGGVEERTDGLVSVYSLDGINIGISKEEAKNRIKPLFRYPSRTNLGTIIQENQPQLP
jgi:hypothetical protein